MKLAGIFRDLRDAIGFGSDKNLDRYDSPVAVNYVSPATANGNPDDVYSFEAGKPNYLDEYGERVLQILLEHDTFGFGYVGDTRDIDVIEDLHICPKTRLRDVVDYDSFDVFAVAGAFEEEFSLRIPDDDAQELFGSSESTFGEVMDYFMNRTGHKQTVEK